MLKIFKVSPNFSLPTQRWNFICLTTVIIAASIVLFLFDPATSKIFPPSPFRLFTGLYCPGCGTLRALHQLLHGHLGKAFGLNPLMVISLPFLAYTYLSYGFQAINQRSLPQFFIEAKWIWFVLQIVIAYWIVRNIPVFPFSWLAP